MEVIKEFYSGFSIMNQEISLILVLVFVLLADLFCGEKNKKAMQLCAITAFALNVIYGFTLTVGSTCVSSFAGMYETSDMHILVKNILNVGTLIVFFFAHYWNSHENKSQSGEFYFLMLSTLLGMYLMISSGNFLLFYIGLETASIPMAAMVAFNKKAQESAEAAAKYILTAAFSSGVMLFGISLIYGTCGTLYFNGVGDAFQAEPLQVMAMILFIAGIGFKISLVPFHLWTADTYQGAPTAVTAYLSVMSQGAAAFAFLCILFKAFHNYPESWQNILWWIIVITITVGNLFAIRQKNLKRFLAFSSISQAGYIMLGVISGTAQGMAATVFYIFIYLFTNLAAFGIISNIENKTGKVGMDDYDGLYSTNKKLALVMMLAMFSLGGIPFFAGFFSKFFIFMAAAQQEQYLLVFLALANTIISLYYYLLVVKAMFIKKSENPIPAIKSDTMTVIGLSICTIGMIVLGFISPIYEYMASISFGM
ncbi:MAG: NADH-quinone oxidoreductase subunit N [Paludibacteraceae bacterium]|nr:NADH-quinone oxidoreductase subunit N [Paludibacteraceae bacterium]